jgi:GT2 family glycosyltransferase
MIPKKLNTRILPSNNFISSQVESEELYESLDNDPFFEIISHKKSFKAGWYIISYDFKLYKGEIILPKIYFDFGAGYSELHHWKLFYEKNRLFGLVKIPWDCQKLRLDISETNIQFKPGNLEFRKIHKTYAIFYLFNILKKFNITPASVLTSIIKEEGFGNKKAIIKSIANGSYFSLDYHKDPLREINAALQSYEIPLAEVLKYSTLKKDVLDIFIKEVNGLKQQNPAPVNPNTKVDIVLPVYNGIQYLKKLIPQIYERSDLPFTLYIIDDASPDEQTVAFLQEAQNIYKDIVITRNTHNLGFTQTVNKLFSKCSADVIVLLNSDIEIPFGWLSKLIRPLLHDKTIATVTPISNAATICSFPEMKDNFVLPDEELNRINRELGKMDLFYEEIPTGVGFCMAISKKALDTIGHLDEKNFPRGYGEEVDLCFRAAKKGFKNILNANLYITHKHGGSFQAEEKIKLQTAHQKKIEKLHPNFTSSLNHYFANNRFIYIKLALILKLAKEEGKEILVFFDHDLGGGTNLYSKNYQQKHSDKVFIYGQYINPNANEDKKIAFSINYKSNLLKFGVNDIDILFSFLDYYGLLPGEIIINNIVSYNKPLTFINKVVAYKQAKNIKLSVFCHDYYYLCPNFLLFTENNQFCRLPSDQKVCASCLENLNKIIDPQLITEEFTTLLEWRATWGKVLSQNTDQIVAFSDTTKSLLIKQWPQLQLKIEVIPHELVGFKKFDEKVYNIAILGNIHSIAKGAQFVRDLANHIDKNKLKNFTLINFGGINPHYDHHVIIKKGPYQLQNLHYALVTAKIDVILIPSVCAETFSFTTREAIESGIPTACFNFGGQYDQVKKYSKGIVVDKIDPAALLEQIELYFKKQEDERI